MISLGGGFWHTDWTLGESQMGQGVPETSYCLPDRGRRGHPKNPRGRSEGRVNGEAWNGTKLPQLLTPAWDAVLGTVRRPIWGGWEGVLGPPLMWAAG